MNELREPKQGDLLVQTRRILESTGNKRIDSLTDQTKHTYAFKMTAQSGLPFILIVKGSDLMGDILSTQKELVEQWHGPIVLAWKRSSDLNASYYVFDPEAIMQNSAFTNERFGVKMVNFSIKLGKPWKLDSSLDVVWDLLKRKRSASLDTFTEKYRGFPC